MINTAFDLPHGTIIVEDIPLESGEDLNQILVGITAAAGIEFCESLGGSSRQATANEKAWLFGNRAERRRRRRRR